MKNPWITTYSGRQFFVLRASEDDIHIEDIAHSLSNLCRYVGHCKTFYSVAEHCCRLVDIVPEDLKLQALLHDASEAYLSDLAHPVKEFLLDYQRLEARLMVVIYSKYGIRGGQDLQISVQEGRLTAAEYRDLMNHRPGVPMISSPYPVEGTIVPWSSIEAEQEFLRLFGRLYGRDNH